MRSTGEKLPQHEIQSVEVSCFVHATEDGAKVKSAVVRALGVGEGPSEEPLEGHFGNPIIHLVWHASGDAAWTVFGRLVEFMGEGGRNEVLGGLERQTDEHGALYLRLEQTGARSGRGAFLLERPYQGQSEAEEVHDERQHRAVLSEADGAGMMHPRKRKRYLLLTSETEVPQESRTELTRLLLQRYPDLDQKKMVWVGNSLIFRTDQLRLPEMKLSLVLRVGEVTLTPRMASGSISKLKRAAESR